MSFQSKHRFIKTGAQFFFLLNRNEFLVSLELQPNFLIGGDVKQRYTQDGDRTQSRIRYKDDADFYNFRRFNLLTDLRIQYGWLVASAGIEALPMFREGLGPDLRKAFFSIGLTIPPSMQFEPTKALEKLDKLEFDM